MLRCVLALAVLMSVAYAQNVKYYAHTQGIMAIANVNADTMNILVVSSSTIFKLAVIAYGNDTIYSKDFNANEKSTKISDIKLSNSQKTALQTQDVQLSYSIQGVSRSTPFATVGQYASSIDSVPSSTASALAFITGSNLYLTSTALETPLAVIRATPGCTGRAAAVCTSYPCTVSSLDYSGSSSYYIDISSDAVSAVYASGTLVSTKNTTIEFAPNSCAGTETGSPSSQSDSSAAIAIVIIVILVILCCVCCIGVAIGIGVCWWQKSKSKNANAYNTVQSPTSPTVVVQGSNSVVMQTPVVAPQPAKVQQQVVPQPNAQQRQPSMPQQQYPPQQAYAQQPQNIPMQQGYQQTQPQYAQQYPPQQGSAKMHYAPQQGAPVYTQQPPPQYMQQQPPQQVKTPDI